MYELIKSAFFFVDESQKYPKKILNNIFGFVSQPLERILQNCRNQNNINNRYKCM